MPRIFISYRRSDSAAVSGRIYDRLCLAFGEQAIFKDVDAIPPGANYPAMLNEAVARCDVLLVVIGLHWLDAHEANGQRRLDNPDDFVRIEVEAGLSRDTVLVIPVLVEEGTMPPAAELPASLRPLYYRNAASVRNDPDFNRDVGRLITTIRDHYPPSDEQLEKMGQSPAQTPAPTKQKMVLPWMGILIGVLIVISVLATLRLIQRVGERVNDGNATATAVMLTQTAPFVTATTAP